MRIILIRHGETDWNESGRFQGWEDRPLTAQGRRTAADVGRLLSVKGVVDFELWSSDLARARDTAVLAFGRDPIEDPRLRELDFGDFGGRTYAENESKFGTRFSAWVESRGHPTPPGGESLAAFQARLSNWWEELLRGERSDRTIVAVAHGGVLQALLSSLVESERWLENGDACVVHSSPDLPTRIEHWPHEPTGHTE